MTSIISVLLLISAMTAAALATANCDMQSDGNTWWKDNFEMKCVVEPGLWKTVVNDCRTPNSKLRIGKGNERQDGECTYSCEENADGTLGMSASCERPVEIVPNENSNIVVGPPVDSDKCNMNKNGNTWWEGQFQQQCKVATGGWSTEVVDCRTRLGTPIGVENSVTENGCTTRCFRGDNGLLQWSSRGTCL